MLGYSIGWLGVTIHKKWGAFLYIGLTIVNIVLFFMLHSHHDITTYRSSLFMIDILLCFFILFYFKKLE